MDINFLGKKAKESLNELRILDMNKKKKLIEKMAYSIEKNSSIILEANKKDLKKADSFGMKEIMKDRLLLNPKRIKDMSSSMFQVANLSDPIGEVEKMWRNKDGLIIGKQRVPLGVIGIIYESRPNVTTEAATLCFKTGNSIILRGGKEAFYSNQTLVEILQSTLKENGISPFCIQFVYDSSYKVVQEMMKMNDYIDLLIPRGSEKLIRSVKKYATVPVIETGTGNNHIYVDESADLNMAIDIIKNAKVQRPSVCNSVETILVHKKIAEIFLPKLEKKLKKLVELRVDDLGKNILINAVSVSEKDWSQEFLDYILAIKIVSSIDEAILHINHYNTKHSEAIITDSYSASQKFLNEVDAAAVYVNASTRFTDGFMFGFGSEIGISTQKVHTRGPIGINDLTSVKYIIYGNGQIRM